MTTLRVQVALAFGVAAAMSAAENASAQNFVVQPDPELVIGMLEGPTEYLFDGIVGAVALNDGRFAVADCGSAEIRWYSASGRHIRTVGRMGDGPGEFRVIARLLNGPGGRLGVYDIVLNRVTVMDREGSVVRTIKVPHGVDVVALLENGIIGVRNTPASRRIADEGELLRDRAHILRFDGVDTVPRTLAVLPGLESFQTGDERVGVRTSSIKLDVYRTLSIAALPDRIVIGTQDEAPITEYAFDGRIVRTFVGAPAPVVTAKLRAEWIDAAVGLAIPARRDAARKLWSSFPSPQRMPAYGAFLADADGRLWIQDGYRPGFASTRWSLWEAGRQSGSVVLPLDFHPLAFVGDRVVGVQVAEVQRLLVLKLSPSTGDASPLRVDSPGPNALRGSRLGCYLRR